MIEIKGKVNTALCFATIIEDEAIEQIRRMCEWNFSAPHGAGRIMSRTKAKESLDLDEYRKAMEGIYTTSVNENTIDEAPMAYKSLEDIIDVIRESVDVIEVLKLIYNY